LSVHIAEIAEALEECFKSVRPQRTWVERKKA
jgi:hypothetical protein